MLSVEGCGSVVVAILFNVIPLVCGNSLFCYALLCVHSSFAIIMKRKRKLFDFLVLYYRCIIINEGMKRTIISKNHHLRTDSSLGQWGGGA